MEHFNYDPNLFCSGNRAKQSIRITFGMWHYRKVMEVDFHSNISGLDAIKCAVEHILDGLPRVGCSPADQIPRIVLEAENGDTLICDDDEDQWDVWLFQMVIAAEIIAVQPSGRVFDPIPGSEVTA